MEFLRTLWLPIVLSAAVVWVLSLVVWMALPHHKNDYVAIPDPPGEGAFMESLRAGGIPPGNYVFPDFRTPEAMKSEGVARALERGPVGHLSLWQPPLTMGGKMAATFAVYVVVSVLIAYLGWVTLPRPAGFGRVFQVVATAGVLAYAFAFIPNAVWFGAYKRTIVAGIIDGVAFGAVTGAIFAWRWPH
jgi:hypothetical protein